MSEPVVCEECGHPQDLGEHNIVLRPPQIQACTICGEGLYTVCVKPAPYTDPDTLAIAPFEAAYRCRQGHMTFGPGPTIQV